MRLMLVTPYLAPDGGGLERYAEALAHHLTEAGHDVTQVGFSDKARYDYEQGYRRVHVRPRLKVSNTPLGLGVYRAVRSLLRAEHFDIVNVHTPVPGAAESAALAAGLSGVPYVVTYHAGRLVGGTPSLDAIAWTHRNTVQRLLLGAAAARIAVSPYVQEHALGGRTATIVSPGVDVARFDERGSSVPGRILFVGPVSASYSWKGFSTLFDAFTRLARKHEGAHLRVVGRGDLVDAYKTRAADLGLDKRITFVGRVSDEDLPREYSESQVVVLPSTTDAESFGMVLAEANACGRAVIGSRIGGIPHFVTHKDNGLLVEPGDGPGLADALLRILTDAKLAAALGQRGAERVRSAHRWETLAARTAAVFESAAARRGRRAKGPTRAIDSHRI